MLKHIFPHNDPLLPILPHTSTIIFIFFFTLFRSYSQSLACRKMFEKTIFSTSLLETRNANDETSPMRTADFNFDLPPELVAQHPSPERGESRLLVLHRKQNCIEHKQFPDLLNYLKPDDVLVLNNSRVIPARLHGINAKTGGKFEMLLLEENAPNDWWMMVRPGKNARIGTEILLQQHKATALSTAFSDCSGKELGGALQNAV